MERVTQEMKWRSLYLQLGMTLSTNASHALKQAYRRQVDLEMMPHSSLAAQEVMSTHT